MAKTKYFTETVEFDVSLSDWTDNDLLEEIRDRGYYVGGDTDLEAIEQYWNRGDKKEALILLEREYPALRGISEILN